MVYSWNVFTAECLDSPFTLAILVLVFLPGNSAQSLSFGFLSTSELSLIVAEPLLLPLVLLELAIGWLELELPPDKMYLIWYKVREIIRLVLDNVDDEIGEES